MAILTKAEILAADDLAVETISVPEWGGEVIVQAMSAARRIQFERSLGEDDPEMRVKLAAYSIVDEQGELLFSPAEVGQLAGKSFEALRRVSDAAMRLAALGRRQLEEARENLSGGQSGGSRSA